MDYKFLLIFLTILLAAIAQTSLKKGGFYNVNQTELYLFVGLGAALYIVVFFLQVYLLRFYPVSKLTPVITIGSMVLIVILGMMIFQETMNPKQVMGVVLGGVSIYLLLS